MTTLKKWLIFGFVYGVLIAGGAMNHSSVTNPKTAVMVSKIASFGHHSLALKTDGTVWAWGKNNKGQLGDGTFISKNIPVQVTGISDIIAIAGGDTHSLALKNDGTVWAWGNNNKGQLGDGTFINKNIPVQVIGISDIIATACGGEHSLALKNDGTVWAWGHNKYGQLGDGTTENRAAPVQVEKLSRIIAIACGYGHSLAFRENGRIWAWGSNKYGQLGDGTTVNRTTPVRIKTLTDVIAAAAGAAHSLALKKNGEVWAWGHNGNGQLGDGTTKNRTNPVKIKEVSGVIAIVCGLKHSMALKKSGITWACGNNKSGQLGDGTTKNRTSPARVKNLSGVIAIAGGTAHSLALKNDGTVWAWGKNNKGQLGDGTTEKRITPVQVNIKAPMPTINIQADPGTIKFGESATLSWSSTDAETCIIEPGIGTVEPDGSITVSPAEDTTYTITATGPGGTAEANVSVVVYPMPTVSIQAVPGSIKTGESSTLSWSSTNADTCAIEPGIGTVESSGSVTVSPIENTTYTITAAGPGGTAEANVSVVVYPMPTVNIQANPATIEIGKSSTLSWNTTGADTCTIEPGIGTIEVSGSTEVSPTENTTYTLTASGAGGTAAGSVTITVTPVNHPPFVSVTGLPVKGNAPLNVTFTAFPNDPDNDALVLTWDFGDGTTQEGGATQTHTYQFQGDFTAVVSVSDGKLQAQAALQVTVGKALVLPPEPAAVAPTLDRTVVTTVKKATEFLYTGENPIQTGVAPGTIEVRRAAVLQGRVLDRDGNAIPGVEVSVLDHPEFGQTLTRANGMFDMAVNGGSLVTLNYEKAGFLPAQRQVNVPWQDYVHAPDVVMIGPDHQVTPIKMKTAAAIQTAQGKSVTDESGTRQATTLFPENTSVEIELPDGTRQELETIHFRVTEYSVGSNGPEAMPAELPAQSAYTYCIELSADEAIAAGAAAVKFSQPLIQYVENFLDFPVGENVPLGYYDRVKGAWMPSDNGRIIKILSVTDDLAQLDIDGSGNPADPAALEQLGITTAECTKLAALYSPGQSLWRMPITHFSPWDANWGIFPPANATSPNQPQAPYNQPTPNPCTTSKCTIEYQNQVLGESVDMTGTPFTLNYRSSRVPGFTASRTVDIPLAGSTYPGSLAVITLEVETAGRKFFKGFPPQKGLRYTFTWDGKDSYGRYVQGQSPMTIKIGYAYKGQYAPVPRFGYRGKGNIISGSRGRSTLSLMQIYNSDQKYTAKLNYWDSRTQGLGGWDLDIHHTYDPVGRILYLGNGEQRSAKNVNAIIETVAGIGGPCNIGAACGDGGPADEAVLYDPVDVLAAPDGSLYIAEGVNRSCIRRVDANGMITKVAGYRAGFSGDGGPATQAWLNGPSGLALGPDGSLYIADTRNHRVRRIGPDGIITTVAGTGTPGGSGDGGPALEAQLYYPTSIAFGPDGSLYIAVGRTVRRIDPDGTINTVAGNGGSCSDSTRAQCLNDGPAVGRPIGDVADIAVDTEGNLYIANTLGGFHGRLRRVGSDGIIRTVTGFEGIRSVAFGPDGSIYIGRGQYNPLFRRLDPDGTVTNIAGYEYKYGAVMGFTGDGGPAGQATFCGGSSQISVGPDGSLYILDGKFYDGYRQCSNNRIRRVSPHLPGVTADNFTIPSEDGSELYVFSAGGRHLRTVNAFTGAVVYQFNYNNSGQLATITDGDNNVTTIERDAEGKPTAIVGPYGQRTVLALDANGWLSRVTNPAGEAQTFTYDSGGLLVSNLNQRGHEHTYEYDNQGRLIRFESPDGRIETLERVKNGSISEVTVTPSEGNSMRYKVETTSGGERMHNNTFTDGSSTSVQYRGDGGHGVTYSNGQSISQANAPDPRWGMAVPVVKSYTTRTPGGLSLTTTATSSAVLTYPGDPLSLKTQTDTLTVNGRKYTSSYDAASRSFTHTTPEGRQSNAVIDLQGRIIQAQWADIEVSTYTYDTRGRLTKIANGTGTEARTTNFSYNTNGYLETITDPLGRTIRLDYDDAGRITKQTLPGERVISYSYDAAGNVSSITPPGRPAHTFELTPGNLISKYTPPGVGAGLNDTTYTYDTKQQPTQITRPGNKTLDFTYDSAGHLSMLTLPTGQVSYSYDTPGCGCQGTGLPAEIKTSDTTLKLVYDGTLMTDQSWSGVVTGSVSRSYDNNFRISKQTINSTSVIDYGYDNDGFLIKAGDLAVTLDAKNGFINGTTLGVVTDTWNYNGFGEPINHSTSVNGTPVYSVQYTRDKLGRITLKTETVEGKTTTYDYTYDDAGRLSEVKTNGVTTSEYQYDSNGNRLAYNAAGNTMSGTYDNQDRLTGYGAATYTYTANGQLKTKTVNSQTTTYEYDILGNLLHVNLPDGTKVEYVIDGQNRRIGKKVDGVLVQGFLYQDDLNPVAQLDGSNNISAAFVYASRVNAPDYMVKNGKTYRIISDNLGSPRLIVDTTSGEIAQRLDYNEFGVITSDTNPGFQPFGFAGGIYDQNTMLVRFGARDYDPFIGRWTAKDPILFDSGDRNLYGYCQNNPVNMIDINGLMEWELLGKPGQKTYFGSEKSLLVKPDGPISIFMERKVPFMRQTAKIHDQWVDSLSNDWTFHLVNIPTMPSAHLYAVTGTTIHYFNNLRKRFNINFFKKSFKNLANRLSQMRKTKQPGCKNP